LGCTRLPAVGPSGRDPRPNDPQTRRAPHPDLLTMIGIRRHTAPHRQFWRGPGQLWASYSAGPLQLAPLDRRPRAGPIGGFFPPWARRERLGPGTAGFENPRSVPLRPGPTPAASRRTLRSRPGTIPSRPVTASPAAPRPGHNPGEFQRPNCQRSSRAETPVLHIISRNPTNASHSRKIFPQLRLINLLVPVVWIVLVPRPGWAGCEPTDTAPPDGGRSRAGTADGRMSDRAWLGAVRPASRGGIGRVGTGTEGLAEPTAVRKRSPRKPGRAAEILRKLPRRQADLGTSPSSSWRPSRVAPGAL
jgi:hypothetical protein